jgi:hypothetical protein
MRKEEEEKKKQRWRKALQHEVLKSLVALGELPANDHPFSISVATSIEHLVLMGLRPDTEICFPSSV